MRCAGVLIMLLSAAACGSSSTSTPPQIQLAFATQPSKTSALAIMVPPVEVTVADETGATRNGTVSITIDPNYCGAVLSGTRTVATQNGVATFMDLSSSLVANGYTLKATFESATATSAPFHITSAMLGETLTEQATICLTPNEQKDASSLAYVPRGDALWTADDNLPGVHAIARSTGAFLDTIREDEFLAAFPDAAICDDGDGDPATSCSYTDEFEVVAFDRSTGNLYVINTVNRQAQIPPVDKPAIFRLAQQSCASCFDFDAWQELPGGFAYNAAVVINGQLIVADDEDLYAYDFASNTVDSGTPLPTQNEHVEGLAFDGSSLWVLHASQLRKIAWPSGTELAVHELGAFSVNDLTGLEVVGDTVYMLEAEPANPIRRFTETAP